MSKAKAAGVQPQVQPQAQPLDDNWHPNETPLGRAILREIRAKQNLFIWGKPATRKTAMVHQVADWYRRHEATGGQYTVIVNRLGQAVDATEVIGIPVPMEKVTIWRHPIWLPTEGAGVIFYDEYPLAEQAIQNATRELFDERRLERCGYKLPDGFAQIAAGNRQVDTNDGTPVGKQIISRFGGSIVVEPPTVDEFTAWALRSGTILPAVLAYLQEWKPTHLYVAPTDEAPEEENWANPRTWEKGSKVVMAQPLKEQTPECQAEVFQAAVGSSVGMQFSSFVRLIQEIGRPSDALADPEGYRLPPPGAIDKRWALAAGLADYVAARLKGGGGVKGKELIRSLLILVERMGPQLGFMSLQMARAQVPGELTVALALEPKWTQDLGKRWGKFFVDEDA